MCSKEILSLGDAISHFFSRWVATCLHKYGWWDICPSDVFPAWKWFTFFKIQLGLESMTPGA